MERLIERVLFASRWLLAPIYLGLALILILLTINFFEEVWHLARVLVVSKSQVTIQTHGADAVPPASGHAADQGLVAPDRPTAGTGSEPLHPDTEQEQEPDMILGALGLIDLSLVASLVVMVMFSGYENFVSRIDIGEGEEKLGWLGKLDAGTLKLKVAASIVAISSIHLLQKFVNIENTPNDKLMWYVIIHLTFVVSALLMGVLDRIAFASHRDDGDAHKSH